MTGEGPSRHTLDAVSRPENADNTDRLTSVADAVNGNESYAFDGVGNRTASHLSNTYTHQPFNRLTVTETGSYSQDANGNTVSKVEGSKRWTYTWDYENRLTQAWDRKTRVRYHYDALGRRVERNLGFGRERTKFTYDGEDVLLDDANGTQTKYLNGPGIDNKLRSKTGGTANYFLADHLGSTNALTDSNGAITSQASYDGFGNQTGSLTTRYGFTGRERDDFTGMMHYRARHYDPKLGRFISEDPIGFAGGDVNLYGYVGNRPLALRDPTGQIPLLAPVIIGGGILILASPSYVNAPGPNDPVFDSRNDLVANGVIGSTLGLGHRVAGGAILSRFCQIGRPKKVTVPAQTAPDLVPEFRPFTYRNFRYNLGQQTGQIPPNSHAHHVFPNEFADDFARAGLNHNDPSFGAWWQSGSHLRYAAQYNREWRNFLATDPSRDDIINFGRAIMTRYGISVGF